MQKNKKLPSSQVLTFTRLRTTSNKTLVREQKKDALVQLSSSRQVSMPTVVSENLTNHQSSLTVCPSLVQNVLNNINQTLIFYGDEQERLDTFLGNPHDPGMALVMMVYLMQEKFKFPHNQFDIRVSFLETNGTEFLDLLTQQNLHPKQIDICQWVRINEYIQYLKAFKVALYNNKKRDFRVSKMDGGDIQIKEGSVFIVRIRVTFKCSQVEVILVDVPMQQTRQKGRNNWQSMLHSFKKQDNRSQQNHLSNYILSKMCPGRLTICYAMSLLSDRFQFNLDKLRQIQDFKVRKPFSKLKLKQTIGCPQQKFKMEEEIGHLVRSLRVATYDSIYHLQETKANLRKWKTFAIGKIKQVGQFVLRIVDNRMKLILHSNYGFSQRRDIVGRTVKSQSLKQFYSAKTYQSLYRQADIKTQQSRKETHRLLDENLSLGTLFSKAIKQKSSLLKDTPIQPHLKSIISLIYETFLQYTLFTKQSPSYWVQFALKRIQVQDKIVEYQAAINSFQECLERNLNTSQCLFKQDNIVSYNNIYLKTNSYLQNRPQPDKLPRLLFKKVETLPSSQKKFQLRLSNLLLKLPKP